MFPFSNCNNSISDLVDKRTACCKRSGALWLETNGAFAILSRGYKWERAIKTFYISDEIRCMTSLLVRFCRVFFGNTHEAFVWSAVLFVFLDKLFFMAFAIIDCINHILRFEFFGSNFSKFLLAFRLYFCKHFWQTFPVLDFDNLRFFFTKC